MLVRCAVCKNKLVDARLVTGRELPGHPFEKWNRFFYRCPHCRNYVSAHQQDGHSITPMGTIVSKRVKTYRRQIHLELDSLWRSSKERDAVYAALSRRLGKTYHTATVNTADEAVEVLEIIKELKEDKRYVRKI